MQPTVSFIFCIHNHQPEGNFDSVFSSAAADAYLPFLELLAKYPAVRVSMHFTGILLEWLERNRPAIFDLLKQRVAAGQVELLSGGFHEPVLPAIPDDDKIGQIGKLTSYIDKKFNVRPRGMWLAERIWEQSLAKPLADAGMEFTVLDDTHFLYAGLHQEQLQGYYITEEQGSSLRLFPADKELRYLIPFGTIENTLSYFRRHADSGGSALLLYADDGEKFGVWPDTKKHVWEDGWLERFFILLEENKSWLRTAHFRDALDTIPPLGRIYLPDASYAEMMLWALLTPESQRTYSAFEQETRRQPALQQYTGYMKGGFWRNFLVKYPEINQMHKRMLKISQRYRDFLELNPSRRADPQFLEARDRLWAAQCNCSYWHGVFGGVYLPHIRQTVFRNLLRAGAMLDSLEEREGIAIQQTDFDSDGKEELLVETPDLSLCFLPSDGGKLVEAGFKPSAVNPLDVLSRREEAYHADVRDAVVKKAGESAGEKLINQPKAKEAQLERYLRYDWYRKGSFIDHLFPGEASVEQFATADYGECGDFANQPYIVTGLTPDGFTLSREGGRWHRGVRHPLRIEKRFRFEEEGAVIRFAYRITNLGGVPVTLRFGIEWNLNAFSGEAFDRYYQFEDASLGDEERRPGSAGIVKNASWFSLTDEWDNFVAYTECSAPAEWWRCPIETVSLSEDGFERTYQGSTVVAVWDVRLGEAWTLEGMHRFDRHHE